MFSVVEFDFDVFKGNLSKGLVRKFRLQVYFQSYIIVAILKIIRICLLREVYISLLWEEKYGVLKEED